MKKCTKVISIVLSLLVLITCNVPLIAADNISVMFTDRNLFIDDEVACCIAELFVRDMVNTGTVAWNSEVEITKITPMYDGYDDGTLTAYIVELEKGYVIVSAYADVRNLIFEWSDEVTPLLDNSKLNIDERIVYRGGLEYYIDSGNDNLVSYDGNSICREDVVSIDIIDRNVSYLTTDALAEIQNKQKVESKYQFDDVTYKVNSGGTGEYGTITDPFEYAAVLYGGTYICEDYVNNWEDDITFHTTSEFENALGNKYYSHCGPTAITNLVRSYANKFGDTIYTSSYEDEALFVKIANIGISNLYYANTPLINGTVDTTAGKYIEKVFKEVGVTDIAVNGSYKAIYSNVKDSLTGNNLLYVMTGKHDLYNYHHVVGYAYTHLRSLNEISYKTFLKIADGWCTGGRYLDLYPPNDLFAPSGIYINYWEVEF